MEHQAIADSDVEKKKNSHLPLVVVKFDDKDEKKSFRCREEKTNILRRNDEKSRECLGRFAERRNLWKLLISAGQSGEAALQR